MTTKESFTKAVAHISNGDIQSSLKVAEQLPFDRFLDFIFYCLEKKQLVNTDFWTFLMETKYCFLFFNSTNSYLFLSNFFKTRSAPPLAKELIVSLAASQPECLCKSIRVSKSFIYDEWYSIFEETLSNHTNKKLKIHFQCFALFRQIENVLWEQVEEKIMLIRAENQTPIGILNELALWYDLKTEFRVSKEMQNNVETLNFAVEFLAFNNFLNIKDSITKETILKSNFTSLDKVKRHEETHKDLPVFGWLDCVKNWNAFNNIVLQLYCYDLNYEPKISKEGIISLTPISIEKVKEWENNGYKINLMFDFYHQTGEDIFNEAKLNGNIKGQKDKSINQSEADFFDTVRISAENAWLNTFSDKNIVLKNSNLNVLEFSRFFGKYSGNCFFRWNKPIVEKQISSGNMSITYLVEVFMQNLIAERDIQWLRHDSYIRLINNLNDIETDSLKLMDLLIQNRPSFRPNEKEKNNGFDRFSIATNLFSKPFLKFGDNLFAFTSIIANTRPYTFLFDNLLKQNKNSVIVKGLSEKFEDRISELFKQAGFATNLGNDKKFENTETGENGDLDALAYKDGYLFVIEAKLAPLRMRMEEAHAELRDSFLKGASQLNKALKIIEFNFVDFKAKLEIKEGSFQELKIFPLIISTSFESDHKRIEWEVNSFMKISWHELMLILNQETNPEKIVSLIEKNIAWELLEYMPSPSITDKLIPLISPLLKKQPISCEKHNQASDFYKNSQFNNAISMLLQAIELDANYSESYVLLGNCYSAINKIEFAGKAYQTAIKVDPYNADAYCQFGCLYYEIFHWDKSFEYFSKSLELNPMDEISLKNFQNAGNMAVNYGTLSLKDFENAKEKLEKRIEMIKFIQLIKFFS